MNNIHNDKEKQEFNIKGEDESKGKLTYSIDNKVINLNGTFVDPKYRSEGLARKLVIAAVEFAKENNYKINPVCSYADKVVKEIAKDLIV